MSIKTNKAQGYILDAIGHLDAIWRTATWITSSEIEAEKLTEDAFKEAYRNRENSMAGPDIRIPLFQILIKACPFNHDWDRPVAVSDIAENDYQPVHNEILSQVGIIPPEFITSAIRNLPLEIRIVMFLSTIEKFSYSEIAQISAGS